MAELHERQRRTVWATGGCSSWYVDEQGRDPTNWPGYTLEYRRRTARVSPDVYALDPAPQAVGVSSSAATAASRRSSTAARRTPPRAGRRRPRAAS